MNAHANIDRTQALRADVQAETSSARQQSAQRELDRFLAAHPQVIHAEYCDLFNANRRVFILKGDTEYEGRSRVSFSQALGDALVKASGGYPKGSSGEGGFIFRHDTGQLVEVRA